MSGSIDPLSGDLGMLGSLLTNSAAIRQQLTTLTQQASTGYQADSYSGLAPATAQAALDLAPAISVLGTRQSAIAAATAQMGVAQTALSQIGSIASALYANLNNITELTPSETDSIATQARDQLQQMAGLLDSQDGGRYVFAGQDSAAAPVPSPDQIDSSGFSSQIASVVSLLGTGNGAATWQSVLALAGSNAAGTSPFSASLSQPAASVNQRLAEVITPGGLVQVGIAASANAYVTSAGAGTSSTGSYMRDIMAALATVGALSSAQTNAGADVQGLVQQVRSSLGNAITALGQDQGELGNRQTMLTVESTTMAQTQTALTGQLSSADQVDTATVLSTLTATQTRLQASYQLMSGLSSLTLTKYL